MRFPLPQTAPLAALLAALALPAAPASAQTPVAPVAPSAGMSDMATSADYEAAMRGLTVTRERERVTIAPSRGMTDMAVETTRGGAAAVTRPTPGQPAAPGRGNSN